MFGEELKICHIKIKNDPKPKITRFNPWSDTKTTTITEFSTNNNNLVTTNSSQYTFRLFHPRISLLVTLWKHYVSPHRPLCDFDFIPIQSGDNFDIDNF